MKNILLITALFFVSELSLAVCNSPISRVNDGALTKLTSVKYNLDHNTAYSRLNELPGDCITNETVTSAKIVNGTVVNADVSESAAIDMSKTRYAVAVLSEKRLYGVGGGTFTAGAWQTRALNTEEDPFDIVTLSANQFTLSAGTYLIEGSAPFSSAVGDCTVKVTNISDSTNAIIGSSEYATPPGTVSVQLRSPFIGVVEITAAKTFAIQHYGSITTADIGFGIALAKDGLSNVYTVVKITRIK